MMVLEPYGRVGRATNETSPGCRRTDPGPGGAGNTAVKDLRRPLVGSGAPEGCRCHGERKGEFIQRPIPLLRKPDVLSPDLPLVRLLAPRQPPLAECRSGVPTVPSLLI